MKQLLDDIDSIVPKLREAKQEKAIFLTTVEAFHKDPELLYAILQIAANMGVDVALAPIKTTDRDYAHYAKKQKKNTDQRAS